MYTTVRQEYVHVVNVSRTVDSLSGWSKSQLKTQLESGSQIKLVINALIFASGISWRFQRNCLNHLSGRSLKFYKGVAQYIYTSQKRETNRLAIYGSLFDIFSADFNRWLGYFKVEQTIAATNFVSANCKSDVSDQGRRKSWKIDWKIFVRWRKRFLNRDLAKQWYK